tara:strand:- start:256 stop:399 length:144 start_codon:yes stop_codon:yes gene_type:complete
MWGYISDRAAAATNPGRVTIFKSTFIMKDEYASDAASLPTSRAQGGT